MKPIRTGKFMCHICGKTCKLVGKQGAPEGIILNGSITINGSVLFDDSTVDNCGNSVIGQTVLCIECMEKLIQGKVPDKDSTWHQFLMTL